MFWTFAKLSMKMKSYSQQDDVGETGIRWEGIGDHADRSERVVDDEVDAV